MNKQQKKRFEEVVKKYKKDPWRNLLEHSLDLMLSICKTKKEFEKNIKKSFQKDVDSRDLFLYIGTGKMPKSGKLNINFKMFTKK